ncbi:peptidoglycan DD-metalloendopeptidase family protein [Corallococcus sicarius]|uniref:M23 family metallopeptidase n=1 Tax=Corallococcus sicarius TaxID=2316726 RepID=A0A3A8NN11_9BACT|nr:peptidoglycan DD-metalloendopeptidase family protein [Corallococcus sicarius]RKH45618.1 M23 family metallopeptidase [Corallococcus sicarius]
MMKLRTLLLLLPCLLWAPLALAQTPDVTTYYEPMEGGAIRYLTMAAPTLGGSPSHQVSLALALRNNQATSVTLTSVLIDFPGTTLLTAMSTSVVVPANAVRNWSFSTPQNIILPNPAPSIIRMRLFFTGYPTPLMETFTLAAYQAPTPSGSNHFWGRVGDLRPHEYWQGMGAVHGTSVQGCQLFAHDVGIYGWTGSGWSDLLPGTDGSQNEHYRQWGKPIYSATAGTVKSFVNTDPTNFPVGSVNPASHGGGNSFIIDNGTYVVGYAHMQAGSLNPSLTTVGAVVRVGDFLGLLGNSGSSSKPHLHIGAIASNKSSTLWSPQCGGPLRPLPLDGAYAIDQAALTPWFGMEHLAPWSPMDGVGIPSGAAPHHINSLIWPSASPPRVLSNAVVNDFALGTNGQLWVVRNNDAVLTTNDRLSIPVDTGVYLDVNPGGAAKAIAVTATTPYVIGTNDFVYRGTSAGWVQTTQTARRITVDESTGKVWAIGLDDKVYAFNPSTLVWSANSPTSSTGKDIAVAQGIAYIIGMDDRVWKHNGSSFVQLPATTTLKRLAVDGTSGKLWGIGANDGLWSSTGGSTWAEHPGGIRAFDLTVFQGTPYVRGLDNGVWKMEGFGSSRVNVVLP